MTDAATAPRPRSSSEEDYVDAYDDGVSGLFEALKLADSEEEGAAAAAAARAHAPVRRLP